MERQVAISMHSVMPVNNSTPTSTNPASAGDVPKNWDFYRSADVKPHISIVAISNIVAISIGMHSVYL